MGVFSQTHASKEKNPILKSNKKFEFFWISWSRRTKSKKWLKHGLGAIKNTINFNIYTKDLKGKEMRRGCRWWEKRGWDAKKMATEMEEK